jgi:L-fuconolactonase
VWDLEKGVYSWLTPEFGSLNRTFEFEELAPTLAHCGVGHVVLVQAADTFEDTRAMLEVARQAPQVVGIVAWAPLEDPRATADVVTQYSETRGVVGVRHLMHNELDEDWVVQGCVLDSLGHVAAAGLTFDVVAVNPRHLSHVPVIAERHPSLRIIIDHLAKPPIKTRELEPWQRLLTDAARYPNVYAKISGLNTAADPETWTAADLQPYIDISLGIFGADRLMFGSDWPVATLAGDYVKVVDETRNALETLTHDEQAWIWGRTARRVYRLPA